MDRIWIRGLTCRTYVGVEEWEQRDRQEVRLDIELESDLHGAGASDRIEDAKRALEEHSAKGLTAEQRENADRVVDLDAETTVCPACGTEFATVGTTRCPECGLNFGG